MSASATASSSDQVIAVPIRRKKTTSASKNVSKPEDPISKPEDPVSKPEDPVSVTEPISKQEPILKPETIVPISSRMSSDNFVLIDNIYRSRMTLLDLLDARGYNVDTFRKFSPAEATAAASSSAFGGLSFLVAKKDNPEMKCDVRYIEMTRQKVETIMNEIPDEDAEKTEYVMMMKGPVTEAHHILSLKQYMRLKENPDESGEKKRRKLRVSFFSLYALVNNPLHHVLVPKHEILPEAEHKTLLESMYVSSKSKLPEIKYHVDPIARCIGAVPGDIVKITRYSLASGEAIIYRVCSP